MERKTEVRGKQEDEGTGGRRDRPTGSHWFPVSTHTQEDVLPLFLSDLLRVVMLGAGGRAGGEC